MALIQGRYYFIILFQLLSYTHSALAASLFITIIGVYSYFQNDHNK